MATNSTDFLAELKGAIRKLKELSAAMPEMMGIELAWERGNISDEEYQAHDAEARRLLELSQAELRRIEVLAAREPAEFQRYLEGQVEKLEQWRSRLEKDPGAAKGGIHSRFLLALLPDVTATLRARLEGCPLKYGLDWALWVGHDTLERLEADEPTP